MNLGYGNMLHRASAAIGLPRTDETCRCVSCNEEVDLDRTDKVPQGRACGQCCQKCEGCMEVRLHSDLFRGMCVLCLEDWCEEIYREFGCDPWADYRVPEPPPGYEVARAWVTAKIAEAKKEVAK